MHLYRSQIFLTKNISFCLAGANVYYTLQDFQNAIADCEKAIQIDPNFTKAHFRLGLAYYELVGTEGAAEKAIESF